MKSIWSALALASVVAMASGQALALDPSAGGSTAASASANTSLGAGSGYRASKLVGSNVLDSTGAAIGKIDDILISPADGQDYAVISVGDGSRLVLVRYNSLGVANNKITLGATKDSLSALPNFSYGS